MFAVVALQSVILENCKRSA